ncbi:hypothetical protein ACWD6I_18840 [Streptomyces sp. NPDC002454]|uniref:hypothetical protein n=1 Tax=Streptomyces sp. NPDC002490 TaxID=3154416 RepID=UPI00332064DB
MTRTATRRRHARRARGDCPARHVCRHRARARVSLDGAFWGGVLTFSSVAGLLAVIVVTVFQGATA